MSPREVSNNKKWEHENEYRFVMIIDDHEEKPSNYLSVVVPICEIYEGCNGSCPVMKSSKGAPLQMTKLRKSNSDYLLI